MQGTSIASLISEAEVRARVDELATAIAAALPPTFTLVGLLKGSFVFVADLARALSEAGCHPRIEFMRVSSYGSGTVQLGYRQPDGRRARRGARRARPAGRRHPGQWPDAGVHPRVPARAQSGQGLDLHPARQAVAARGRVRARSTSSASQFRTCSSSATASTMPSAIASCRSSARWRVERAQAQGARRSCRRLLASSARR